MAHPTQRAPVPSDVEPTASYRAHLKTMNARLEAALAGAGCDALVILAGDLQTPPRDDIPYAFRVEPHVAPGLPLNRVPGAALVLAPGRKPVLLYPQPDDYWHSPPRDPKGFWVEDFDIRTIKTTAVESGNLTKLRAGFALIGNAGGAALPARFDERVLKRLDYDRAYKTDYEVACICAANRIAARGHNRVSRALAIGLSEFELNGLYCAAT